MIKKCQFFLISFIVFDFVLINARYIRHVSVYLQEEIIHGVEFTNSTKSDCGKIEEAFFINKVPVQKSEFYKELEFAQLAQLRKERERSEYQAKSKIIFADSAQVAIIEKLIHKRLQEVIRILEFLQYEQLKQYYVFHKDTIDSMQKLFDIQRFVKDLTAVELKQLVELNDMQKLQETLDKVDQLPDRLETFFQASVQYAIKHSDDTAMLKELLSVLAQ